MKNEKAGTLVVENDNRLIILSMVGKKYNGWYTASDGRIIDEFDDNQIEISYREEDEEGWGAGSDEYLSTTDIKSMANCIRNVTGFKVPRAEYSCQDDIFQMSIEYDSQSNLFSFTVAIMETLLREYHITITKSALNRDLLEEYIHPFFEWEKEFPICM